MGHCFRYHLMLGFLCFLITTWCPVSWGIDNANKIGAHSAGSESFFIPAPGNPIRSYILDALRQELKDFLGAGVVFKVTHFRVKGGWAWIESRPQSQDGKDRYEDVSALLNRKDGIWKVVEIQCAEADNPDCLAGSEYFEELKRRFPAVPPAIFSETE